MEACWEEGGLMRALLDRGGPLSQLSIRDAPVANASTARHKHPGLNGLMCAMVTRCVAHPRHAGKGRPRKEASPATHQWQIVATVTVNQQQLR